MDGSKPMAGKWWVFLSYTSYDFGYHPGGFWSITISYLPRFLVVTPQLPRKTSSAGLAPYFIDSPSHILHHELQSMLLWLVRIMSYIMRTTSKYDYWILLEYCDDHWNHQQPNYHDLHPYVAICGISWYPQLHHIILYAPLTSIN